MFEKRKLLYVEDDSISWLAAEASLESKYSMFRARNAREAFALLADHSFDIVLMDVQLRNSELDGVGIAKFCGDKLRLHNMRATTPPMALRSSSSQPTLRATTAPNLWRWAETMLYQSR